jgi:hypothetical protein
MSGEAVNSDIYSANDMTFMSMRNKIDVTAEKILHNQRLLKLNTTTAFAVMIGKAQNMLITERAKNRKFSTPHNAYLNSIGV